MVFKLRILYWFFYYKWHKIKNQMALERHQAKLLKNLIKKTLHKSPFYKTYKDLPLDQYPILDKFTFMAQFDQINTVGITKENAWQIATKSEASRDFSPMIDRIAVGLSSGTTGNRGIFLVSEKERAHWAGAVLAKVVKPKLRKTKIAFFLRSSNQLYEAASNFIQFHYFDLEKNWEELMLELSTLNPHIIVAQPSVLMAIARKQKEKKLTILPEKMVSVAEILEEEDQQFIEQIFHLKLHQVYQCTEGFLAHTCEHYNLHFNEDIIKVEFKEIDKKNNRYFPIITDLRRTSQPVIRYCLNDIVQLSTDKCPCGSPFKRIKKIEGRQDDMLIFTKCDTGQRVMVFPDFIRRIILYSSDKIESYKIEQTQYLQLNIYLKTEENNSDSIINSIKNQFEIFEKQNNLSNIELNFSMSIPFNPMQKNRRISMQIKDVDKHSYPYL